MGGLRREHDVVGDDAEKVIDAFASAAALPGDPSKGAQVFAKACATCHRLSINGFWHLFSD